MEVEQSIKISNRYTESVLGQINRQNCDLVCEFRNHDLPHLPFKTSFYDDVKYLVNQHGSFSIFITNSNSLKPSFNC
jgi:hypothetical protein